MRKEESEERRDRQGKRREYCLDDLLETLLDGPIGLNAIIEKINEDKFEGAILSPSYSKGTILKYLRQAITDKLVEYIDIERKGVGENRRPIGLTPKGKRRAERNRITNAICVLSEEDFQNFILKYKLTVVRQIVTYFNDRALNEGFYNGGYDENDDDLIKNMTLHTEADLRLHGFKEDEIVQMWLINRGEPVLRVIERFSGPTFFGSHENISEVKHTEEEQLFINNIKQQIASHLRK